MFVGIKKVANLVGKILYVLRVFLYPNSLYFLEAS